MRVAGSGHDGAERGAEVLAPGAAGFLAEHASSGHRTPNLAPRARAYPGTCRFPLECGGTADPMVLMLQVQAITGVSPEEQILLSKSWEGPTAFAAAARLTEEGATLETPEDGVIVLLRESRGARAVSDDPSGAGKPLLVAAPAAAAPGVGGISFLKEKLRQVIIEFMRLVDEPKRATSEQQANRLINNCG